MNQAESEPLSAFQKRLLDLAKTAPRPQVPDVLVHPHRHMQGKASRQLRPPQMRDTGLAILRRPPDAPLTPLRRKAERQLPPPLYLHAHLAYIRHSSCASLKCTFFYGLFPATGASG